MAERIRATVATRWAAGPAEPLPAVTASIGIATYPADGASQEHLIRAADEAVYAAKRGGGDQVRVAPTAARTSP